MNRLIDMLICKARRTRKFTYFKNEKESLITNKINNKILGQNVHEYYKMIFNEETMIHNLKYISIN